MAQPEKKNINAGIKQSASNIEKKEVVLKEEIVLEEKEIAKEVVRDVKVVNSDKTFAASDTIRCRSITAGTLIMIGKKSSNKYRFSNIGDICEVEYQDLESARLTKSQNIFSPLFIIEDEEYISQKKDVREFYENMYSIDEVEEIFNLGIADFKRVLEKLPVGIRNTVKVIAATKIQEGTLDSVNKIKAMDVILGTDLMADIIN